MRMWLKHHRQLFCLKHKMKRFRRLAKRLLSGLLYLFYTHGLQWLTQHYLTWKSQSLASGCGCENLIYFLRRPSTFGWSFLVTLPVFLIKVFKASIIDLILNATIKNKPLFSITKRIKHTFFSSVVCHSHWLLCRWSALQMGPTSRRWTKPAANRSSHPNVIVPYGK